VGARLGEVDARPEIAGRVLRAWQAGRVTAEPPSGAAPARGSLYVRDLLDRSLVFVCRRDLTARELVVITLWEEEGGPVPPRVPRRYTDALRPRKDRGRTDPG
jgi:hypothetical protein